MLVEKEDRNKFVHIEKSIRGDEYVYLEAPLVQLRLDEAELLAQKLVQFVDAARTRSLLTEPVDSDVVMIHYVTPGGSAGRVVAQRGGSLLSGEDSIHWRVGFDWKMVIRTWQELIEEISERGWSNIEVVELTTKKGE